MRIRANLTRCVIAQPAVNRIEITAVVGKVDHGTAQRLYLDGSQNHAGVAGVLLLGGQSSHHRAVKLSTGLGVTEPPT